MAGVLFLANGKRAQSEKANKNQFPNKICYQTNTISSDQLALVGWSVARFLRLCPCSRESLQGHIGYIRPGCMMTELVLHICHHWLHLNSAMASGTQEVESCCRRRRKCNLVTVQEHPAGWETRMRKSCHVRNA